MSRCTSSTSKAPDRPDFHPALDRRTKMIARLEAQKLLLNNPHYTRTVRTWVKKFEHGAMRPSNA
jgi:hypothetical protein